MNWAKKLISLGWRLWALQSRVEENAANIRALRKDLQDLKMLTQQIAYAVQRNQARAEAERGRQEAERENLLLRLQNELLRFELRLPPGEEND